MASAAGLLLFVCLVISTTVRAAAQPTAGNPGRLPEPTGTLAVGRVTLLFEDASRIEPLDPKANVRRIMADVWYPAERSSKKEIASAEYLDVAGFERALGADALRKEFRAAYNAIKMGVGTHALKGAPFASSLRRAPLLIFSSGGGMIRELYASQMEELASHGYIVAAITHSYDGFLSVFPDGSYIAHDAKRWPQIPSFEGEANLNQLDWHTGDILAVLQQLSRLNDGSSSPLPFAGHIDLERVGAFGHSFGGVAAAHACQKDQRLKACLNQDGSMGMKPFYLDVRGWGMNQAFMLIERPPNREPLSDADLAEMKVTRERATDIITRLNANRDNILRSTGMGSYRVLLQRKLTTHMDFSDLPLLSAGNSTERQRCSDVLRVAGGYTRAFFDQYLRGTKAPILEQNATDRLIEAVERFGPAKRPN